MCFWSSRRTYPKEHPRDPRVGHPCPNDSKITELEFPLLKDFVSELTSGSFVEQPYRTRATLAFCKTGE